MPPILVACFSLVTCWIPLASCAAQTAVVETESFQNASLPDDWQVIAGTWRVKNGALTVDSTREDSYITFGGQRQWQNYEVSATIRFDKINTPSRWLSILVRTTKDAKTPWSQVPVRFDTTASNGMEFAVRTRDNKWNIRSKSKATKPSKLSVTRHLKVVVNNTHVQGFLDGEQVVESYLCVDRASGGVGFGASGCVATFDDFHIRRLPDTPTQESNATGSVDNVAHRGFSAIAPENTLAAITEAIRIGATGCEFDVHACSDQTVVLMHDKTIDRTTDGTGRVDELSLNAVRKLDAGSWKSAKFKGEPVPTLSEALELLKGADCQAVIEIKMEGISKQVVEDVRSLDMIEQVAVIAFSQKVIGEIRQLEPRLTCAWLHQKTPAGTVTQQADWLTDQAKQCDAKILDLKSSILTPRLVSELKRRGFGVWTWTVNDPVVMKALKAWGVDSITTDYPDRLEQLRAD